MQIEKTTLLLNKDICLRNIRKMTNKALANGKIFRPHFKTHQSAEIANWFREEGVNQITVSSLTMANYFAAAGWDDITIAFPVNIRELDGIEKLASRISLNILLDNADSILEINNRLKSKVGVFVKIDTGYHRAGIEPEFINEIDELLNLISSCTLLSFKGFLSHYGNTYNAHSKQEIRKIYEQSTQRLVTLKSIFTAKYPGLIISIGDTPSASLISGFNGIDELRPGNFVFYDSMQYLLGSCSLTDIAIALACPVTARYEKRKEIVVYGGAIHLSHDSAIHPDGFTFYGFIARLRGNKWDVLPESNYVKSISQEHGVVKLQDSVFDSVKIGDLIAILPIHSCMTANSMGKYLVDGKNFITNMSNKSFD